MVVVNGGGEWWWWSSSRKILTSLCFAVHFVLLVLLVNPFIISHFHCFTVSRFTGFTRNFSLVSRRLRSHSPMMAKAFTAPVASTQLTPMSETWLLLQLDMVYHEKLLIDARCDHKRLPRILLPEFLYDVYLYKYGVRPIAEKQLHTLFYNVRRHCHASSRARLFALQMGMGKELELSIEANFKAGSDSSR